MSYVISHQQNETFHELIVQLIDLRQEVSNVVMSVVMCVKSIN